jgi:8-oxo-dGTP pyrophosphatase MutT (NUDIX family)
MSNDVWKSGLKVVYAKEDLPTEVVKSLFLAGPTPRNKDIEGWRQGALETLEQLGYDGHVFVPEPRDGKFSGDYVDQVEWETNALNQADSIVFWVPRSSPKMLGLTTNIEWGLWADTGKCVLGTPAGAEHVRYLQWMAAKMKVPNYSTLDATLQEAVEKLGAGAFRKGGDAQVPLHVWSHPTFQEWLLSQKKVGNRLESARVLWTFRVGQQLEKVFSWCLHVNVYIAAEKRWKMNEYVMGRTDVSAIALYYKPDVGSILDIEFVLVREFRSPARTESGFITEFPSGSTSKSTGVNSAVEELEEETSIKIDPSRLRMLDQLQLAGTMSSHTSTLCVGELTKEERDKIESLAGKTFGDQDETEVTYVELHTLRQIIDSKLVDWTTLGMILEALTTDDGLSLRILPKQ